MPQRRILITFAPFPIPYSTVDVCDSRSRGVTNLADRR